jgi:acyl-CoA dehydrogenase
MSDLPQERLIVAVHAMAMIERALRLTIDYVKERQVFGKKVIEFQNTQFVLAECKTEATLAKVFIDHCIGQHITGKLDTVTASMAKYWITDTQGKIIDHCLQLLAAILYGGISDLAHVPGRPGNAFMPAPTIMKVLIARSL